jgi:hypothetical protein
MLLVPKLFNVITLGQHIFYYNDQMISITNYILILNNLMLEVLTIIVVVIILEGMLFETTTYPHLNA